MYNETHMLGWGINIYKASQPKTDNSNDFIATWECGLGGDAWVRNNCEKIEDNSGYPIKYRTIGKFIKTMLKDGAVKQVSENTVIHEAEGIVEHAGQEGWSDKERIDFKRLKELDDNEVIIIDTWDLS